MICLTNFTRLWNVCEFLGQFRCHSNGQCINEKFLCDGDFDCKDGSDESALNDGPCNASRNCTNLGANAFRCDGNRCIVGSAVCDGISHCSDNTDESHCGHVGCVPDTQFQCKETKQCFPINWVCDGHIDCPDGSDEAENCRECEEFLCNNTNCVPIANLCDG